MAKSSAKPTKKSDYKKPCPVCDDEDEGMEVEMKMPMMKKMEKKGKK